MRFTLSRAVIATALTACVNSTAAEPVPEQSPSALDVLRADYERRFQQLEARLAQADSTSNTAPRGNELNPAIGLILNGHYQHFSNDDAELAGFAVAEEAERGEAGFSIEHTEFNFSSNVDDVFSAGVNLAIAEHQGETEIELEEAYVRTRPESGLPAGLEITLGRTLWALGYLNEHHMHTDDFADRPLPYRVYLEQAFNDDGLQLSYLLPTDTFIEIGAGVFRGNDFPFGGAHGNGFDAWSAFARIGGDIGLNHSWRLGLSMLKGESEDGRLSNEDTLSFIGDSQLMIADVRYIYTPSDANAAGEIILQAEWFQRDENGVYNDTTITSGDIAFDDSSSGWYGQLIYDFGNRWRTGLRMSRLNPADAPGGLAGGVLDAEAHQPESLSGMIDWSNSEFSRLRLQVTRERLAAHQQDTQFMLQYIVSLGAHGAHRF